MLNYRIARVPKGRGSFRQIFIASDKDAKRLQSLIPQLEQILIKNDHAKVNYAFEKGKNCALNASRHIGFRYTLALDLKNFFASVHRTHLTSLIPEEILDQCLIDGVPQQGLPTSPLIATIAFVACDKEIIEQLGTHNIHAVYTRYADDLVFSFNKKENAEIIQSIVKKVVEASGFKVNERKTSLQDSQNGRVVITGLGVDHSGLHPTRRTRKKIRAAVHQNNIESLRGLIEWSKCKLPRMAEEVHTAVKVTTSLEPEVNVKAIAKDGNYWIPSPLGRWLTRSSNWNLSVNERNLSVVVEGVAYQVNAEDESTYLIHAGLFWTDVTIYPKKGFSIKVDGLLNSDGIFLRKALNDILTEKRIRDDVRFLHRTHRAINKWIKFKVKLEQTAEEEQRWFTHEMRSAVLSNRPIVDITSVRSRMSNPLVANRLSFHLRQTIEPSLVIWSADHHPAWTERNKQHTLRELKNCKDLLSKVESKPLTDDQARAVICFDNRVQVVASAGSGKTSVMVAKAAYAIYRKLIPPEKIVMLAFNKQAAEELKERTSKAFNRLNIKNVEVEASTFHSLGLRIIGSATGEKPDIPDWATDTTSGFRKLTEIVDDLKDKSSTFRANWDLFRFVFGKDLPVWGSQEPSDTWDTEGNGRIRTVRGEPVKSQEEAMIANWLFYNGIEYKYEESYVHRTVNKDYRQYKPDFYYPSINLYHEHFALNAKGEPPASFTDYMAGVHWKRQLHIDKGTILFETTSHGLRNGNDLQRLANELTQRGLVLDPNPDREIPQAGQKPMGSAELIGLIRTFISHAKSNSLSISALRHRLNSITEGTFALRYRMFLSIAEPIFEAWDAALAAENGIDFEDMLNMAAEHLESGRYSAPYDLVMADEFQDASCARARLCKALVNQADRFLFAVGDDWQSINRFAGADVSVMTGFKGWFNNGQVLKLEQTFRCPQQLCDISSQFITKNPSQIPKRVHSETPAHGAVLQAFQVDHKNQLSDAIYQFTLKLAEDVQNKTVSPGRDGKVSIYVLGRYNSDRQYLPRLEARFDRYVSISFLTIHRSKGSEADYVILPEMVNPMRGRSFPSTQTNDPLLTLAMPAGDEYPLSEERRLFYVALTRARRSVAMFTVKGQHSFFLNELEKSEDVAITRTDGKPTHEETCPACKQGVLVSRTGPYGEFRSCSNFPLCAYKPKQKTFASSKLENYK